MYMGVGAGAASSVGKSAPTRLCSCFIVTDLPGCLRKYWLLQASDKGITESIFRMTFFLRVGGNGVCPGLGHILLIVGTTFQMKWETGKCKPVTSFGENMDSGFLHRIEVRGLTGYLCSSSAHACVFLPVSGYVIMDMYTYMHEYGV